MPYKVWRQGKFVGNSFAQLSPDSLERAGAGIVVEVDAPPRELAVGITDEDPFGTLALVPYPKDFESLVARNLQMIEMTRTGRVILPELCRPTGQVVISATAPEVGNQVRSMSQGSMSRVTAEVLSNAPGALQDTQTAVKQASRESDLKAAANWLVAQVDSAPELSWPETQAPAPWVTAATGVSHRGKAYGVDADLGKNLHDWLAGNPFFDARTKYGQKYFDHIRLSTIGVLDSQARCGGGSGAAIGWNVNPAFAANRERPPGIGLAHELIHAYFSLKGLQPGRDDSDISTVLFEYKCVGLGFWDDCVPSENSIRQDWCLIREFFPGYWLNVSDGGYAYELDKANHKAPHAKRVRYGLG
jgi:hypothetical protein